MNKDFRKMFARAKQEKRSCLIGFVTGMDPDYKTSKQILIEMSKYCDAIEVGNPFNTSTSDSSIIMDANMRAINSGANTAKIFKLIKEVKSEIKNDIPFIIMGYLNPIYIYSIKKFAKSCKDSKVSGCIVVDSNNNAPEDQEIFRELSKVNVSYIKLIAPTNDLPYIKESLKKCSSWIYVVSYAGITGSKKVNLSNVKKSIKLIRKASKIPVGVGFGVKTVQDVKNVSKLSDAVICGSSIVNKIAEGHKKKLKGKKLATFVGKYVKKLSKGLSKR